MSASDDHLFRVTLYILRQVKPPRVARGVFFGTRGAARSVPSILCLTPFHYYDLIDGWKQKLELTLKDLWGARAANTR